MLSLGQQSDDKRVIKSDVDSFFFDQRGIDFNDGWVLSFVSFSYVLKVVHENLG